MATNQIEKFGLKNMLGGRPLNKHLCKTIVKITALR